MAKVTKDDNINKLRLLVDELERTDSSTDNYKTTLRGIESLIKDELYLISKMQRPDNKLRRYENICAGILTLISSTKI